MNYKGCSVWMDNTWMRRLWRDGNWGYDAGGTYGNYLKLCPECFKMLPQHMTAPLSEDHDQITYISNNE